MDLKIRNSYGVHQAEQHTDKIWCESVNKFWSYRPKSDLIQLIHIIWIGKRIILTSVAISSTYR